MGCTVTKQTMLEEYRADHMPYAKELAAKPRHLQNNITFIPVNYINGECPKRYPKWLKNTISSTQYSIIIAKLNELNKYSLIWNEKRLLQYAKLPRSKARTVMQRDKTTYNDQLDILLLDINNAILNPLGLTASSTLRTLHVKPSQMGIKIKHIHIPPSTSMQTTPKMGEFVILSTYEENVGHDKAREKDVRSFSNLPSI